MHRCDIGRSAISATGIRDVSVHYELIGSCFSAQSRRSSVPSRPLLSDAITRKLTATRNGCAPIGSDASVLKSARSNGAPELSLNGTHGCGYFQHFSMRRYEYAASSEVAWIMSKYCSTAEQRNPNFYVQTIRGPLFGQRVSLLPIVSNGRGRNANGPRGAKAAAAYEQADARLVVLCIKRLESLNGPLEVVPNGSLQH